MTGRLTVAMWVIALASHAVVAQDPGRADPKGPPPHFITVRNVDDAKGEMRFELTILSLVPPDGKERPVPGAKPKFAHLTGRGNVSLKKAKWAGGDGKEVGAEEAAKRLKPGVTVLLSADGAAVDPAYLRLFKEDTLVLTLPAEEWPVPSRPQAGGVVPAKPGGDR